MNPKIKEMMVWLIEESEELYSVYLWKNGTTDRDDKEQADRKAKIAEALAALDEPEPPPTWTDFVGDLNKMRDGIYLVQTQDGKLGLLSRDSIDWLIVKRYIGPFEPELKEVPMAMLEEAAEATHDDLLLQELRELAARYGYRVVE